MNRRKFNNELKKYSLEEVQHKNIVVSRPFHQSDVKGLFNSKKSLFNDVKMEILIEENFDRLLAVRDENSLSEIIEQLSQYPQMKAFLTKPETIRKVITNSNVIEFIGCIRDNKIKNVVCKHINDNLDWFLSNTSIDKVSTSLNYVNFSEYNKQKIKKHFQEHKSEYLRYSLKDKLKDMNPTSYDSLFEILENIVDQIVKKENSSVGDLKIIGGGATSCVIGIGDTIIKLGSERATYDMPNHHRILQPWIRWDLSKQLKIPAIIEVSDRVLPAYNISIEQRYQIYKEMREKGIVYGDMSPSNLGMLLKDNCPKKDDRNGLHGNIDKILQKGEYVILDTDFIYREDDPNMPVESFSIDSLAFEKRYRKEKGIEVDLLNANDKKSINNGI